MNLSEKITASMIAGWFLVLPFAEAADIPDAQKIVNVPAYSSQLYQESYRLGKYDAIKIVVVGYEDGFFSEKGADLIIGPDGYVNLPYVGSIQLAGLTLQQASDLLKTRLSEYLVIPSLSVMIKEFGKKKVYVMGEVVKPGLYELNGEYMNVFAAISSAGGITKRGRPKHIAVARVDNGKLHMQEVNFDRFIEQQDATQNLSLADGDMVYIPRSNKIDLYEDVLPILNAYGLYKAITK